MDRWLGLLGLGLTLFGVVAPYVWHAMPSYLTLPILGLGIWLILYSSAGLLLHLAKKHLMPYHVRDAIERARDRIAAWMVIEWLHPADATRRFGDPLLLERATEIESELAEIDHQKDALDVEFRETSYPDADARAEAHSRYLQQIEYLSARYHDARARGDATENLLLGSVRQKLLQRLLIAKASPVVDGTAAAKDGLIPRDQWKFLDLDAGMGEAKGHGWHYVGVEIGRTRKKQRP